MVERRTENPCVASPILASGKWQNLMRDKLLTENLGVGSPILPPGILKTCLKQVFYFTKKEPNRQDATVGGYLFITNNESVGLIFDWQGDR